jgi:hypothetical protein
VEEEMQAYILIAFNNEKKIKIARLVKEEMPEYIFDRNPSTSSIVRQY